MKIHIVQRNDTFESIANKYDVSVQDLIGMNTHINQLAGLVPGLKVKVPESSRKEEANVAQHIQKYYPNLDMSPVELKTATTAETKAHKPPFSAEDEAVPIPMKPLPNETAKPSHPNDGVKINMAKEEKKNIHKEIKFHEEFLKGSEKKSVHHEQHSYHQLPFYHGGEVPHGWHHQGNPMPANCHPVHDWNQGSYPMAPPCCSPGFHDWNQGYPIPPGYPQPTPDWGHPSSCCPPPIYSMPPGHDMMRQDERFFGFPGWGWGPPFWGWGWGRPWWGWGRPGWGGHHHRSPEEIYQPPAY